MDVDVHVFSSAYPATYLARNDVDATIDAVPGTYFLAVESYVDGMGTTRSDECLLVVLLE